MKKLVSGLLFLAASTFLNAQENPPKRLTAEVNSGYDEWAPVASPDGSTLYFSRLGHPQNMGEADAADIWITYRRAGGQWPRAVNAGVPLNSRQAEQVAGVHASGRKLYLYNPDNQSLSYSNCEGRTWQPPLPIAIDSFSPEDKAASFSFMPDGSVMLASVEHKGSLGGRDIYFSFAGNNSRYAPLRHLGPAPNSPADETGLFLAADGKTLYFSSGRPGGRGGQDLYLTRRLDDSWSNWSPPANLGPDINTGEDDLFLSMPASGHPVYLLRREEDGSLDIYETSLPDSLLPEAVVLLAGTIKDAATGKVLPEAIPRLQTLNGRVAPGDNSAWPGEGRFQLILPHNQDFMLTAILNGYYPASERLELSGQMAEELDQDNSLLLASLNRDPAYTQRNADIINLQLHLRALDEEMIAINEQRKALRQAITAHRLEGPEWKAPSGPGLDALKHRYYQYQAQDTIIPASYEIYLRDSAKSFESIEQEVRQNLEQELAPEVGQELSALLLEEVKRELEPSLGEKERRQLELKEELLRQEISQSFASPAGRPENWTAKGPAAETEWERQLKEGLKTAMAPAVRESLRQELKDDIRAALRNDISYWAKKETQAELQAELNEKLQLQIEQEKRRAAAAATYAESVAPLAPPSGPKPEYREIQKDLLLARAEPGQVIPFHTVVFEPDMPVLKPVSYAELSQAVEFLRQNEHFLVEIGVHAAGQLSHTKALSLTTQRAKAVASYLVTHGIDPNRLIHKGYGKSFPIADNNTPEGQRLNQRVEMRILANTH